MSNRLTHRFTSFLNRFEEQLEVDCERLKRQLATQVDQQFGAVRSKVAELVNRFGGRKVRSARTLPIVLDGPLMEIVSLDQWKQEHGAADEIACEIANTPSTSSGTNRNNKRKSDAPRSAANNKRHKPTGSNKCECKYPGCGKSFMFDKDLVRHERIHMGVKPFSCTWNNCSYSSEQRSYVVTHVRIRHFKLPKSIKEQQRLNIEDNRNPNDFIQVDAELLARRLE